MPEGDTVWLAGRHLDEALRGHRIVASDFRVPQLATADLSGRRVLEVASRGKHLLLRMSAREGDPRGADDAVPLTLHTHFRMEGSWHVYRPGERWRGGPSFQVRAVLRTGDRVAVGYRLPVVELLRTADEDSVVGHLGPDLLAGDWGPTLAAEAVRRLAARPDREIAAALLDQRNLAGLGNMYAVELCFLRGASPYTPVRDVADLPRWVDLGHRLLDANKEHAAQATTGDPRAGRDHWVYGRSGQPCRRCGTTIRLAEVGEAPTARLSYWCPRCQPGPAPEMGQRMPPREPTPRFGPGSRPRADRGYRRFGSGAR